MKQRYRVAVGCSAYAPNENKISDRWRERLPLRVKCGSHPKPERRAASGSLHRLVRRQVSHGAYLSARQPHKGKDKSARKKRFLDLIREILSALRKTRKER